MATPVIQVENLSKLYRLGEVGTGSIQHDINRWWHRIRGKEDPYTKIGAKTTGKRGADSNYVWALQDVSFKINQGEVLGIIGRNGAGKSTLLKLFSRVTSPTTGNIKIKGRLASLLEVGSGFHPELTGRENIYLNGAILGMSRAEVKSKFDEIAAFAGVEQFLDTPVKRYSSGMYVRLAFSVAAHLDPDVLVVDEVLAVGDADFQKRCIERMDAVAKSGRTVIFVSHNLGALQALCDTAIRLEDGRLVSHSHDVEGEIASYLAATVHSSANELPCQLSPEFKLLKFKAEPSQLREGGTSVIEVLLEAECATRITDCALIITDVKGARVTVVDPRMKGAFPLKMEKGLLNLSFQIHSLPLVAGTYKIGLYVVSDMTNHYAPNLEQIILLDEAVSNFTPYPAEHRGQLILDFSVCSSIEKE